tara:strand:- start:382 stop:594 length:213 start_codon:yes stop_codon:yes gene_type:complete
MIINMPRATGIGKKITIIGVSGTLISFLFCFNPVALPCMLVTSFYFVGFTLAGLTFSCLENNGAFRICLE